MIVCFVYFCLILYIMYYYYFCNVYIFIDTYALLYVMYYYYFCNVYIFIDTYALLYVMYYYFCNVYIFIDTYALLYVMYYYYFCNVYIFIDTYALFCIFFAIWHCPATLMFFCAFSSVVRQMPGCTSQKQARSALFVMSELCCSMYCLLCKCVLYYCHWVSTQLQLNINHHIINCN